MVCIEVPTYILILKQVVSILKLNEVRRGLSYWRDRDMIGDLLTTVTDEANFGNINISV